MPDVANPYRGHVEEVDAYAGCDVQRARQLGAYLAHRQTTARFILVAEAPGYRGARFTGVPMTSERMLQRNGRAAVFGDPRLFRRTSHAAICRRDIERAEGLAESTATVVWKALAAAGTESDAVLWNAFPFHPHRPGEPLSNRRPTARELEATADVLPHLLSLFPGARVVAIGTVARERLRAIGVEAVAVRHPANGGAAAFRAGMRGVVGG